MHRVRAYTFDFCCFLSVTYTTLNKLFAVFVYIIVKYFGVCFVAGLKFKASPHEMKIFFS